MCKLIKFLSLFSSLALIGCFPNGVKNESPADIATSAARKLDLIPVYPLTSDMRPGDIYLSVQPTESCVKKLNGKLNSVLLTKRIERIEIDEIKKALISDAKQRLSALKLDDITINKHDSTNEYDFPTVSFPAFSYSRLLGDTFGVSSGVYGVGLNKQQTENIDVSFDDVSSMGIPPLRMMDIIKNSQVIDNLLNPAAQHNLSLLAQSMFNSVNKDNICPKDAFDKSYFVVNVIFAAKQVNISFKDTSSLAAEVKGHLIGLKNFADKVKSKASDTQNPTDSSVPSQSSAKSPPLDTSTSGASSSKQFEAIDALVSSDSPSVSNTIGYNESGEVAIKKTFKLPMVFGFSQAFSFQFKRKADLTLSDNPKNLPVVVVQTPLDDNLAKNKTFSTIILMKPISE